VPFEKNKLMFICPKLDARKNINLVGIEAFAKLLHLICDLFKSDKKISKIQHQRFFVSHPVYTYTGYFTSDNEPDGIKNATHNTFGK
jgi:hypothetical protein